MITDIKQPILLVTEPGKEDESIIRLSRVGYDHTLGYLKGGFVAWKNALKEYETINRISASDLEKQYNTSQPLIVDVRKKSEYDSQHVVNAINIPLNQLNSHLASFPKNKPFILHCAAGYRSMIAASILKQRGWDNFTDVIGGFAEIAKTAVLKTDLVCQTTML